MIQQMGLKIVLATAAFMRNIMAGFLPVVCLLKRQASWK